MELHQISSKLQNLEYSQHAQEPLQWQSSTSLKLVSFFLSPKKYKSRPLQRSKGGVGGHAAGGDIS